MPQTCFQWELKGRNTLGRLRGRGADGDRLREWDRDTWGPWFTTSGGAAGLADGDTGI